MRDQRSLSRRDFIVATGAGTVIGRSVAAGAASQRDAVPESPVPRRPLGRTGAQVSILGIGGYHLGAAADQQEATTIVARALDAGINFFDNAWEYHSGESELRLGHALRGRREDAFIMTKVCTHGRDKAVALQMLDESLRRLQTDHIDLWQIHEVIYDNDPDLIFRPNGAAEALAAAKQQGKVRFVGFTGHKSPAMHLAMLRQGFPFDAVQMPLNCLDATFRSFETAVLPEATRRGIAVLGMKSFGGSGEIITNGVATPEEALRYAMSLPVATTISGIDSIDVLMQNLSIARAFMPMSGTDQQQLRDRCRDFAADGRFELFKTTKKYDGEPGREQHGFPSSRALPV